MFVSKDKEDVSGGGLGCMLTYKLTNVTLKIQVKLSGFRWAAWKCFLRVQALLVAVQICLWVILFCCMCSWGLEPFRPHSCRLPASCVYQAVQYSQVPGIQDADVLLSLETEASSSPQVVGPLIQSPLPSEEPSPYIISSDWRCGKLMGAQCS